MKNFNKLISKYDIMSPAVKAGLWFTICNILQRGIQFVATPLYTRILSPDDYGMFSLFTSWLSIFTVFASLNLAGGVFYNGLIKYESDKYRFTSAVQSLGTISTILCFFFISIIYPIVNDVIGLPYYLVVVMFFIIAVNPAFLFWSVQERIQYKYKKLVIITLMNSIIIPFVGIVLVVFLQMGYLGVIWGYVAGNVIVSSCFYIKNLSLGKTFYNKPYWKFSLEFSLPLIPHYLSQILLAQTGRITVNYYLGTFLAGIFSLGQQISLVMNLVTSGINNALVPWMYRTMKMEDYEKLKKGTLSVAKLVIIITMGIMLIGPELIFIFGTKDYLLAKWIIPPIMFSTSITFVYCMYGTILFYFEETKKVALATSLGAVINVLINYLLVPKYGIVASAYAMVIGYGIIYLLYYYYTSVVCELKGIKIDNLFDIEKINKMLIVLIMFSFATLYLYKIANLLRYALVVLIILITLFEINKIEQYK